MPLDDEKSLDTIAGLLDANLNAGSDEADASIEEEDDNSAEDEAEGAEGDESSEDDAEDGDADENDAGDEGEGDGEAEGETAQGAGAEEPFFTLKIEGRDVKVSRSEAMDGYQRQSDYTRKTQELAEVRKGAEAEVTQYRAHREQYANVLKVLLERVGDGTTDPTEQEWNDLRASDPERYAVEHADYTRRREQREKIKAEQKRVDDEKREEQTTALKNFVTEQRGKLLEAMPEWKDEAKGKAGMQRVREYALKNGFSDQEVSAAYDHRFVVALDKARRYDDIMAAKKAALKKIEPAPDMPAPGGRTPQKNAKTVKRDDAKKELKKSGKLEDNLSLLDA